MLYRFLLYIILFFILLFFFFLIFIRHFLFIIILLFLVIVGNGIERLSNTKLQQDQVEVLRALSKSVQSIENNLSPVNTISYRVDSLEKKVKVIFDRMESPNVQPTVKSTSSPKRILTQPRNTNR